MITTNLFETIAAAYNEGFKRGQEYAASHEVTAESIKFKTPGKKKRAGRPKGSKNKTQSEKQLSS